MIFGDWYPSLFSAPLTTPDSNILGIDRARLSCYERRVCNYDYRRVSNCFFKSSTTSGMSCFSGFLSSSTPLSSPFSWPSLRVCTLALLAISELSRCAPTPYREDLRDLISADSLSSSDKSSLNPFCSDSTGLLISMCMLCLRSLLTEWNSYLIPYSRRFMSSF
jgi:hypothetical protein